MHCTRALPSRHAVSRPPRAARSPPLHLSSQRGGYDFEPWSVEVDELPLSIDARVRGFDFVRSTDAQVSACAAAIFQSIKAEAEPLTSSNITRALARACVLRHESLAAAVAAIVSRKVGECDETRAALEQAMRDKLSEAWGLRCITADRCDRGGGRQAQQFPAGALGRHQ